MPVSLLTPPAERGAVLALGFGATVAMWAAGYFLRLPWIQAPSWIVGLVLLALLATTGALAGRFAAGGWRTGATSGLLTMALNMLILGSLLATGEAPNRLRPGAAIWLPGALLAGAFVGGIGARLGAARCNPRRRSPNWSGIFAAVAAAATLCLVTIGGLVTSNDAGLAVVDWPNSFGYNMFLYPLSRMTGGVYYEHAHRLFGSLVGLTTLVLAVFLHLTESRRWVRRLALLAFVLVVLQGVLGGLRVTGRFTLSADPAATSPNLVLAVVHGVAGQLFFALMVALAVFQSRGFHVAPGAMLAPGAATDRGLAIFLALSTAIQLVLGAVLRHTGAGLLVHITMATLVTGFAVAAGSRAWGLHGQLPLLKWTGISLLSLVALQLTLGVIALAAVTMRPQGSPAPLWEAVATTMHQVNGALVLAASVTLVIWSYRLLTAVPAKIPAPA